MDDNKSKIPTQYYAYNAEKVNLIRSNANECFPLWLENYKHDSSVHWLNFHSIDCKEEIEDFATEMGLHPLSVEDIYTFVQRPKVEEFDNYIFFSLRSLEPNTSSKELKKEQLSFILGSNYLISFQEKKSDHFTEVRERIEFDKGRIRKRGADYLLYKLLEAIIDNYFEVIEDVQQKIEEYDIRMAEEDDHALFKEIEAEKRQLIELRQVVFPLKELFGQLEKLNNIQIDEENKYYFSDLKDNCLSLLDEIESNKSILEGLGNIYYAIQGQKMNEIMKVLTIVGAIFIPLTFIAGIYGMNFDNIPELHYKNAYFYCMGVMIFLAIAMLVYFKRKKWL